MLNQADIQALRAKGTSNSEILKMMGRVVPSAAKAYADMEADQRTSAAVKDSIIGKMLDEQTPKNAPSGLPYMHAVSIASAQKSHDSLEKQYQSFESQQSQSPPDEGFSLGGVAAGIGQNLKAMGRAALGAPMVGTYHLFKTADDLSSFLAGKPPTKLRPDQEQFVKDLHTQAYKDLPQAAMLYSGMGGMSALNIGLTSGGIASGQKALAKAGVAPEGMPTGNDVSLLSVPYEGAKAFVDGYTTFTGPLKSVIAKNTLYSAASQVLDGMVYDTPQKSMGKLLQDSLASGITSGLVYKGMEKMRSANAVKDFINEKAPDVEAPKIGGEDVSAGGRSVIPGEQFNPNKPPTVGQSTIEQLSGLRPQSQEVAFDPQGRAMVEDFRSGKVSPQKLVLEDLANNFKKTMDDVSDMGKEYNFVRSSKQSMFLPVDDFRAVLKKYDYAFIPDGKPKSNPVDGLMTQPGTVEGGAMAKPISGEQFNHLTMAMNILEAPSVTPQMMRTAKGLLQDLGKFYDPKLPGGGGDARAMAGELLSVLEGARRSPDAPSDFRKYAELDDKYAPLRKEYDRIKDEFFESDALTGELRMKDNAPAKILNSLRGTKYNLLERLETASPGITRKIRAYEAYRDIVSNNIPGQYVKAGAKMAGQLTALGGVMSVNPVTIGAGIVGILASSPAVMWSALSKYAQLTEAKGWDPLGIVMKAEHGAPFTPEEVAAVQGTVKVITEKYAMPQETKAPNAEARLVNLKGGKKGTPGIDFPAAPPKGGVDMDALIAKYGSEDAIPLNELSPQGVADAEAGHKILEAGGSVEEADAVSGASAPPKIKPKKVSPGIWEYPEIYHGSTKSGLSELDPAKSQRISFGAKAAVSGTDNLRLAESFTKGELGDKPAGPIYRVEGPFRIIDTRSAAGKKIWEGLGKSPEKAIQAGYDGIQFPHLEDLKLEAFYKDIPIDEVSGAKEIQIFRKASVRTLENNTDSLASPMPSRHNEGMKTITKAKFTAKDVSTKFYLESWRDNGDGDSLANLIGDDSRVRSWLRKSYGKEAVDLFEENSKAAAREYGQDVAEFADSLVESAGLSNIEVGKILGDRYSPLDIPRSEIEAALDATSPKSMSADIPEGIKNIGDGFVEKLAKDRGEGYARELVDNFTEGYLKGNKATGTVLEKGYLKALQDLGKKLQQSKARRDADASRVSLSEKVAKYENLRKIAESAESPDQFVVQAMEKMGSALGDNAMEQWQGLTDMVKGDFKSLSEFYDAAQKESGGMERFAEQPTGREMYNRRRGISKAVTPKKSVPLREQVTKQMASEVLENWDGDPMDGTFVDFFESKAVKQALGKELWDKMDENLSLGGLRHSQVEKIFSVAKKLSK